jgi:ADP-heptose:LPS heptosyltransferase
MVVRRFLSPSITRCYTPAVAFSVSQFAEQTHGAHRVLVIDLGFLGDAIHLLPSLWELRRHYSRAEIHLLASTSACEVVGLTRSVDRLWPLEMRREKRTLTEQWKVLRQVHKLRCDVAINLNAADRSIILMGVSGARHRSALRGGRWHAWNRWLIPYWLPEPDRTLPIFEQLRQALTGGGFELREPRFGLEVPDSARSWAADRVPQGAVHMSLCSANVLKEWPADHHAQLVSLLREADPELPIAVSASARPREQKQVHTFMKKSGSHSVVRLPSAMTLAELMAVLARCRLHIGPDSGVIHLAMALGIPTVSIFRRRGEGWRGWVPVGDRHRAFLQDCTCLRDRGSPCAAVGSPRCLESLSPDSVFQACKELLLPSSDEENRGFRG